MPTAVRPSLRIHRPPGDEPPWPPRADPSRRPVRRTEDAAWLRYGRTPNGVPAGCYLDVAVHRGRPPAGVDARYDADSGKWVSIRFVDPAGPSVMGDTGRGG